MFEMGLIVAAGLLVLLVKLSWKWRMRVLSNPVIADVLIFSVLTILHWGTFSGVMVATIGALACSVVLSCGRWMFGYVDKGNYVAGKFDIGRSL